MRKVLFTESQIKRILEAESVDCGYLDINSPGTEAPDNVEDLFSFIEEIPYWTKKQHGKKYRLMYQIYSHPKYHEYGRNFFKGVDERYSRYAESLEEKLHIPSEILTGLIFILIRACVHYALFEDEFYLKAQLSVLKESLNMYLAKYGS